MLMCRLTALLQLTQGCGEERAIVGVKSEVVLMSMSRIMLG